MEAVGQKLISPSAAGRADTSPTLFAVALSVAVVTIIFFMIQFSLIGLRATDKDITDIFSLFNGQLGLGDVARERHFLVEAILPNVYGAFLKTVGLSDKLSRVVWTVTGLAILYGSFVYAVYRGRIQLMTLVSILAFAAIFKTILVWYGKSDPFLFALLFLFAIQPPQAKVAAPLTFLAVLCHPSATLVAVLGFTIAQYLYHRSFSVWPILGTLAGLVLQTGLMHFFFEDYQGRISFASEGFWTLVANGLPHTVSFFAISILVPAAILLSVGNRPRLSFLSLMLLVAAIAVPFLIALYVTLDHSRVFVIITLPMFIVALAANEDALLTLWRERTALAVVFAGLVMGAPYLDGFGWQSFQLNIINAIFADGWL